ncbi:MAG: AAA family ATPase [Actinobacteria bacterium]|nr:AAA family ATPase [Actinomycetota bacterium]
MPSDNFEPLQTRWPQLYEHASFAEQYAHTDPHTAIVKLRCFAEQLVGILYRELNLPCERSDGFFEKLKSDIFIEVIDEQILEKLHAIRMLGNKAAHGRNVYSNDALALLRDSYLIGQWMFKTYSGSINYSYPPYSEPCHPDISLNHLSQNNKELEEQLEKVKEELLKLEESERIAQNKAIELWKELDQVKLDEFKDASLKAASSFDLSPESTRQLIKLHDAFSEYNLTDGQRSLVDKLELFLSSREESVFLLKGYAGTGKTFITKGLTEYFRAIGRNYVLAAPTGKASKVIAKKTQSPAYTIHKTIYSFKDISEYKEDNLDGSETFKFYAQLAVNEMSADTVYIVDESSMIADVYHEEEFFRFGTGYLLRDFFKFVNLDHNDHSKKVIFIGDDAQLPPVGMNFSPALDQKYLSREHNIKSTLFELTEVVRQKSDSGVMLNSINLRKSLKSGVFNQLSIDTSYPDIINVSHQDLLDVYLESCNRKINAESIVLAHSNSDVAAYNRKIRQHFFPDNLEISAGDKVMAVSNSNAYGFFISNGDFGLVREILSPTERRQITLRRKNSETNEVEEISVSLAFKDVNIGFKDLDGTPHFFNAKILEDLLYSEQPGLTSDESKALYLDFCIRHPHLKRGSLEFKETLRSDSYFNALRLKFGYAITCHKAQGSEWNHVFVKCKTHQSQLSADYFRWLYTAITRTSKNLYLLDPPNIKIGAGIRAVNYPNTLSSKANSKDNSKENHQEKSASAYPIDTDKDENFSIPSHARFSLEVLERVRRLLKASDVKIQDVTQGQYLEIYFFEENSEITRIDIGYNGKGKITRITAPTQSDLGLKLIEILSPINGMLIVPEASGSGSDFEFGEEFLNEFHARLTPLVSERGIKINNVESMDWKQRYTFTQSGECAVIDIFYNGKNQFTKYAPVNNFCTSDTLVSEIQTVITQGLSS